LPFPHVVFNRCYANRTKTIRRIERIIGENKIFNYMNCFNKWDIYKILKKTKVKKYLPYTCLYKEKRVQKVFRSNSLIFLKPCIGNQGSGVYRIEQNNEQIRISENSLPPKYIWHLDNEELINNL